MRMVLGVHKFSFRYKGKDKGTIVKLHTNKKQQQILSTAILSTPQEAPVKISGMLNDL
jgi:hypothetical protein